MSTASRFSGLQLSAQAASTLATNTTGLYADTNATLHLLSTVTDGASAVAHILDTVNAFSTAGDKLLSIRAAGSEKIFVTTNDATFAGPSIESTGILGLSNSSGDSFSLQTNVIYTRTNNVIRTVLNTVQFYPQSDNALANGIPGQAWQSVAAYWYSTKLGAQLTVSSNAITPTAGLHHVVGGTLVKTINTTNVPASTNVSVRLVVDTSTLTWDATGNISVASTSAIPVGSFVDFMWDGTKWNPSRVS